MTYTPSAAVIEAAMQHAADAAPHESCGLVIHGLYVPMENVHHDPARAFELEALELLAALQKGGVEAVVHSHYGLPPTPSSPDLTSCEQSNLPWLIVSWPSRTWLVTEPSGYRAPLIGRQFSWGLHDCYALIRDGLSDYSGIVLPDVERHWQFWLEGGFDHVRTLYPQLGFVEMAPGTRLQQCDLLVMRLRGRVPNHMGLFIEPDKILHQMSGRLSCMEVYGGVWQQCTEIHLRHRDLIADHVPDAGQMVEPAARIAPPPVAYSMGRRL